MSTTSSAFDATYWFIQPSRSVKRRCMAFSLTPPQPISLVTKINVASCRVSRSNSSFRAPRASSTDGCSHSALSRRKKKLVHHSVMQSTTATLPLRSWRPFLAAPLLVFGHPLAELVVPDVRRRHVNGRRAEAQRQAFCISALAGTLPSGYHYNLSHCVGKVTIKIRKGRIANHRYSL